MVGVARPGWAVRVHPWPPIRADVGGCVCRATPARMSIVANWGTPSHFRLALYLPLAWGCRPAWFGAWCDRRVIDVYCQAPNGAFRRTDRPRLLVGTSWWP